MKLTIFNSLKFFLRALVLFFILTHIFSWLLYGYNDNLEISKEVMLSQSVNNIVFLRASVALLPFVIITAAWSCHYWSKRVFITAFSTSLIYFCMNFSLSSYELSFYLVPVSCLAVLKGFMASIWKKKEIVIDLGSEALPT